MTDLRCLCIKTFLLEQIKIWLIKDALVTYLNLYAFLIFVIGKKNP